MKTTIHGHGHSSLYSKDTMEMVDGKLADWQIGRLAVAATQVGAAAELDLLRLRSQLSLRFVRLAPWSSCF